MRARATALALVNWKGVFYERYLLDPNVTALEGANGAGKTTVMIAAYVVLLPDLSRLRFTNLGESGATGGDKGIWGRLGEPGRPSYAALEIDLGAERILAGVHLERKGEPSLELTPFLVSGLDLKGSLKQVFLLEDGDHDEVPELQQLKRRIEVLGGELRAFSSTKDYFAALFDRGVTPLRLATDEERNKLNEMLRTSMTGGISRALTSDLRNFLLKEETGLGDTLSRMRANLDACSRTRLEVSEARRLEHEINGVYDAGQAMFSAALLALRQGADEQQSALEQQERVREEAHAALGDLEARGGEVIRRQRTLTAALDEARQRRDELRARREQLERVLHLQVRRLEVERELEPLSERAAAAAEARTRASVEREAAKQGVHAAREAYERAARGLGDVQGGLSELHRNAHLQGHLRRLLRELRSEGLSVPDADELAASSEGLGRFHELARERSQQREELAKTQARWAREAALHTTRRSEYSEALAALGRCVGPVQTEQAHAVARALLAQTAELEHRVARLGALEVERERLRDLAARQERARSSAVHLGLDTSLGRAAVEGALQGTDAELSGHRETRAAAERAAQEARARADALREKLRTLEAQALRWSECAAAADRLAPVLESGSGNALLATRDFEAARRVLETRRADLHAERAAAEERRDALLAEASQLESSGAPVPAALLELRDELDAELLAGRFEEIDPAEAARLEAQLGPLAQALVVRDPEAVAQVLLDTDRKLDTVWLVSPDLHLGPDADDAGHTHLGAGADLVVREAQGLRITRIPEQPTLGRRARERRCRELREAAEAAAEAHEGALAALRRLDAASQDLDFLLSERALLAAGDPAPAVAHAQAELASCQEREQTERERAATLGELTAALRERSEALRALWGDAHLLDPPDFTARLAELEEECRRAQEARAQLERTQADRALLAQLVDALRDPPPPDEELLLRAERLDELTREAERLARQERALAELVAHQNLLTGPDYEALLSAQTEVMPALEAQHEAARQHLAAAEEAQQRCEECWEEATRQAQAAEAELAAARAHVERARAEAAAGDLGELSEAAVREALELNAVALTEASSAVVALEQEERVLATEVALFEERRTRAEQRAREAAELFDSLAARARPLLEEWQRVSEAAQVARVRQSALSRRALEAYGDRSSIDLAAEARSKAVLLLDRLEAARGGAEGASAVRAELERPEPERREQSEAQRALAAWLATRDWLKRRLPTQVAEVDDPVEALGELRDRLTVLESRLQRQEGDLRGASEDVARGIEVQIRRATAQVRRLGQHLEGVSFGSIEGIRVRMRRSERMAQVLEALREGAAQELLFQSSLPIEEALDEIFRRFGGGRTGGQRLLDYREYLELSVEIQRRGKAEWEPALPTRLSTGEAIGVGAALMMVVLTEWERDANLLRPRRDFGSLRFLFLDEANRLSQDNLAVLFDLCQNLDLQLLIAAPEVARASGNTTYRLVRRVTEDGHEEVLVSGRRTEPTTTEPTTTEPTTTEPTALGTAPASVETAADPGRSFTAAMGRDS
jgi:chromosome partition protein MukB